MTNQELVPFCRYVESFYGPHGIYPMGATKAHIMQASHQFVRNLPAPSYFEGDSVDREFVRDILIADFGYIFPA